MSQRVCSHTFPTTSPECTRGGKLTQSKEERTKKEIVNEKYFVCLWQTAKQHEVPRRDATEAQTKLNQTKKTFMEFVGEMGSWKNVIRFFCKVKGVAQMIKCQMKMTEQSFSPASNKITSEQFFYEVWKVINGSTS